MSAVTPSSGKHRLVLRLLLAAALTTSVALHNRFPLTYYDSASYLKKAYAFTHAVQPLSLHVEDYRSFQPPSGSPFTNPFFYRPAPYTLFLVPFATPVTLWALPLAQGLLVAFAVSVALRTAGVQLSTRGFLALFAGLTACTSLPWFTGQVMPDVFTGLLVLLTYVALWGGDRLPDRDRNVASALLAFTLATHLSHLPLFVGLLAAGLAWQAAVDRVAIDLPGVGRRAVLPLVLAVAALVACNLVFIRKPVVSESSGLFYLARLVGDGTAQRYLERACPTRGYLLCAERGNLPQDADHFLWAPDGAWSKYQNDPRFLAEAGAIVRGTLWQEWPAQIAASLRNTATQLGSIRTDLDLHESDGQVRPLMALFGAPTLAAYQASLQARRELPLERAGEIQVWAVIVSLVVLVGLAPWGLAGRGGAGGLLWMALSGVVLNAAVVGTLSSVHDRYESRVIWLVPLAVFAVLAARYRAAPALRAVRWLYEENAGTVVPQSAFEPQPAAPAAGAPSA
ncbi:MAG TPA: hypothetical protein VFS11_09610 [Gemmatimonadales bacterium]|nr:hypothetical protein [Gemmatimonadales bacterium]